MTLHSTISLPLLFSDNSLLGENVHHTTHIMTTAMHIMSADKESYVFCINPCVTYPPQRTRLLSNVNVFGGLFLC